MAKKNQIEQEENFEEISEENLGKKAEEAKDTDALEAIKNCNTDNSESEEPQSELEALKEELEKVKKDLALRTEQALKARADADNIQKRAQKDIENAHKFALDKFVPELLKVKDSLEIGTKTAKESKEANLNTFIEGSDMTIKMFSDILSKFNVEEVKSLGEKLNPEIHQALTTIETKEFESKTIAEVIQKGYKLNDRLVRPAMVIVAK